MSFRHKKYAKSSAIGNVASTISIWPLSTNPTVSPRRCYDPPLISLLVLRVSISRDKNARIQASRGILRSIIIGSILYKRYSFSSVLIVLLPYSAEKFQLLTCTQNVVEPNYFLHSIASLILALIVFCMVEKQCQTSIREDRKD